MKTKKAKEKRKAPLKPSDILKRGWCQLRSAEMRDGTPVRATDPRAVRWCLIGAAQCAFEGNDSQVDAFINATRRHLFFVAIADWNDAPDRTQDQVVRAAEAAEKEMGL